MPDSPLYVPCPRCKGERVVYAYTDLGGDFSPSRWEGFRCPLCRGTAEADRDLAKAWEDAYTDADV